MSKKELAVKKSNYLNQASYKLSVIEQKMIAVLAAQISDDETDFKTYSLDIQQFRRLTGIESMNYGYIVSIAKSLLDRDVHFRYTNEYGQNIEVNTKWLSSCVHVEGSGTVEMNFDNVLKPFLLQLKNRFTVYRLENIIQLSSQFSIRIYELLKQYEGLGLRIFTLPELREYIGISDDQYRLYADFKRRVIVASQKELKEKCDLYFDFEEVKVGRGVGKLIFHIKTQPMPTKNIVLETPQKSDEEVQLSELLSVVRSEYRNSKTVKRAISEYLAKEGFDYVKRNVIYANLNSDKKYTNYLSKSLKFDYGLGTQEELEIKQEEVARKEEAQRKENEQKKKEAQRIEADYAKHKKAVELLKNLSDAERENLELEAKAKLEAEGKPLVGIAGNMDLTHKMEELVLTAFKEV